MFFSDYIKRKNKSSLNLRSEKQVQSIDWDIQSQGDVHFPEQNETLKFL